MKTTELKKRYEQLARKVEPKGWICMGSAIERSYSRLAAGRTKQFGPYYSLTRKINNKTVTIALTRRQFNLIRQAIRRNQQLENTIAKLRDLSLHLIISETPCVAKRMRICDH
mgnify:CR=1 FL=1